MSDEQLELSFEGSPFVLRLPIDEGFKIFRDTYWCHLPKSKTTRVCFLRISEFCALRDIRFVDEFSKASMEDLRRWLAQKGLKQNTVNTHHVIVTRFYRKLDEWKEAKKHAGVDFTRITLPAKNPGSQVPKVNELQFARRVAWPKKLVYRFIEAAVLLNDLELAEDIEMLYLTGLRLGDLWRMTDANVDLAHMVLSGIQNKSITSRMPSGRAYLIAISPRMATILRRRASIKNPGSFLFGNAKYTYNSWRRIVNYRFNVIRNYLRMPHVQLCHMRPAGATLLADNLVDLETIREKYGWSTLRMLPVYARRTLVHQRHAQKVIEDKDTEILM